MRRRSVFAVVIALGALSCSATAHPPAIVSPAEEKGTIEEVIAFRKDLTAAIVAKDKTKLTAMYAKGFMQTHGTGEQDGREARIAAILGGAQAIETLPAEDLVVRIFGGGWTAVATGKSRRTTPAGEKQYLAWTAVYVRTEKSWELAASQVTRLAEPKAKP
jgi:Domain of unknown function (DUF4440)